MKKCLCAKHNPYFKVVISHHLWMSINISIHPLVCSFRRSDFWRGPFWILILWTCTTLRSSSSLFHKTSKKHSERKTVVQTGYFAATQIIQNPKIFVHGPPPWYPWSWVTGVFWGIFATWHIFFYHSQDHHSIRVFWQCRVFLVFQENSTVVFWIETGRAFMMPLLHPSVAY